ncbi:MAG: FeoB-associated Cys-rich membrane protein [Flavobacteriaceae bacterium]|nr:FeoB-associated Cys-rich membrane protein [Flavobacteriaceae bacterium]
MSNTIQTILVIVTVSIAVGFLIKKFFLKPKKSSKNSCEDDCGCH